MQSKPYDLIVYIGRFQPFHFGHYKVARYAQSISENLLILIGSSESPRTPKNPWTFLERAEMVRCLPSLNLYIRPVPDVMYDDSAWVAIVDGCIEEIKSRTNAKKIGIIGFNKDESSYYLDYFKQRTTFVQAPEFSAGDQPLSSTDIRSSMFNGLHVFTKSVLPIDVYSKFVENFVKTYHFEDLKKDYQAVSDYKKAWANSPYPPIFTTVDCVVVQSGHILLVKRGAYPGKGLWALPGGFVNQNEHILDAAIRELREETGLHVAEKVLRGSIRKVKVFDNPDRSSRGRTITHVHGIRLDDKKDLPRVTGGDDAVEAKWFSFGEFYGMQRVMFEDHYFIGRSIVSQI